MDQECKNLTEKDNSVNSTVNEMYTGVSEIYNSNQTLYVDTSSRPTNTSSNIGSWSYSPISLSSPDLYVNQLTRSIKSEPMNSYSGGLQTNSNSEYSYNSQDLDDNYQAADWPHLCQWYYASSYATVAADRSIKHTYVHSNMMSPTLYTTDTLPVNAFQTQQGSHDLGRCSTPDLISALASIPTETQKFNQGLSSLLSPESQDKGSIKLNDSGNVSVVTELGTPNMYVQLAQRYQDSGYNSDLCMSPVYPYESKTLSALSIDLKSEGNSSDDENKENIYKDANMSQYISNVDGKPLDTATVLQDFIKEQSTSDLLLQHDHQIQSSDISSSNFMSPSASGNQNSKSGSIICHKMPTLLPQKPNIKKCESASKRKISDAEINAVMLRESKRQRHNQPLNLNAVRIMSDWYEAHRDNPYPSKTEKEEMAKKGGITVTQVKSWFANKRNRSNNTKPKVQKRQMTERLLEICHQLARSAKQPATNNADIIQQLSTIITTPNLDE